MTSLDGAASWYSNPDKPSERIGQMKDVSTGAKAYIGTSYGYLKSSDPG